MSRPLLILVLLALLSGACGRAVGNPGVAAAVGDVEIPVSLVNQRYAEFAASQAYESALAQQSAIETERQVVGGVLGQLIQTELLVQALQARDIAIPDDAEVQSELEGIILQQFGSQEAFDEQVVDAQGISMDAAFEQVRLGLLIQSLQDEVLASLEIEEADIQAAYEAQLGQVTVSHILVASQEEAQDVLDRLADGEDFATLAIELSTDPGSGQQGGLLGPLTLGAYVPEFEAAAVALEPGAYSEPVQTDFGWHIITTSAPPPLDEVREQAESIARQTIGQRAVEDAFNELLFADDVVVNPRFGRWDSLQRTVTFSDPLGPLEPVDGVVPDLQAPPGEAAPPTSG